MRGRQRGRYHVKHNNCQHFVEELWRRVCAKSHGMEDDSLRSVGMLAKKYSVRDECGEKEASIFSGVTIRVDKCSCSSLSSSSIVD